MGRKTGRALAGIGAFATGFLKGQEIGLRLRQAKRESDMLDELSAVDGNFTPTETQVASGDEAMQHFRGNYVQPEGGPTADEFIASNPETFKGLDSRPASVVRSMGIGRDFRQQAAPFTPTEVDEAKTAARAGIYSRHGREDDATRVLLNQSRRRELADQQELRAALNPQSKLLAATSTDMADVVGGTPPQSAGNTASIVRTEGTDAPIQREKDGQASSAYYQQKAPQVLDALVKQGKFAEAKAYRDFVDSEKGRAYADKWSRGVRKLAIGDHEGAVKEWEVLYNNQLFDDGRRVKLTPTEGGMMNVTQFDTDGKEIGRRSMPIDKLAYEAGVALAPEKLIEMRMRQQEAREKDGATLDRQIQLETLRQQGREVAEDRRDARLVKQIEAGNARAANRGGLTAAQQRSNFEIDAAREMVAGLSDEDIRQRTAPTTATGRTDDLFDPALARAAKLASRRKIGDDETFDARTATKPAAQPAANRKPAGTPKERAMAALTANPETAGFTLGDQTPQGFKVLDKSGKLAGYLRPEPKR